MQGGLSQVSRMQSEYIIDKAYRLNLQNTRSYLHTQQEGLHSVLKIYDRMEALSIRAMDTTASEADRKSFNDEFTALVEQLEEMMSSTYQVPSIV